MAHNSVVGKLVNGGDPNQLSREIVLALAEAGKFGYEVIFKEAEMAPEQLTLTFVRKSKKQLSYCNDTFGGIVEALGKRSSRI